METNKRLILKLGAVLIGVLLFLTFFSNTIYSLKLAAVTASFPTDGVIVRTYRSEGTVDFSENVYLYADVAGKITLSVREGDVISEGDNLFALRSDMEDIYDRLLSETNRLEKLGIQVEQTESELRYRQTLLNELTPGTERITETPLPDMQGFDYELERLATEIENAEKEYDSLQLLYDAGAATLMELNGMEASLVALRMEYRQNEEKKEKILLEYERAVENAAADDKRNREEQLKDYETQRQSIINLIEEQRYRLDGYALDENEARRAISKLNEQIGAGGVVTVCAETDGVVGEIPDGVETGAYINRNQLVVRLGIASASDERGSYRTTVLFPESVDFLAEGESIKLNIKSRRLYGLDGVVEKLGFENGRIRADVVFDAEGLVGGERVEAVAELVSQLYEKVLPNSAIRRDTEGDFILYIERSPNSMMGYSYYVKRIQVYIISQDERKTAIVMYSDITEPIIVNSDRPLASGDRVRLVNENELVGTR